MSLKKRSASIRCAVFAVGAVLASFTTFGIERTAQRGVWVWSDPKAWDPEGEPKSGDKIGVPTSAAGSSLTLNKDVTISIPTFNLLLSSASGTGRFVGTGYTFAPAASAVPVTYPFAAGADVFRLTGTSTRAPYAMTDADISFSHDATAGFKAVDFNVGTFNFYDADGSATDRSVNLFGDTSAARVTFGPQVSLKVPNLSLVSSSTASAGDVVLVFNGATAMVAGKLAYAPNAAAPHRIDVVITNKADVSIGSLEAASTITTGGDAANPMRFGLTVKDAALTVNGTTGFSSSHLYNAYDVLFDGATYVSTHEASNAGTVFGIAQNHVDGNSLVVRDSKILCSNSLFMVGLQYPKDWMVGCQSIDASFDNTMIETKKLALYPATRSLGFTNCVVNLLGGKLEYQLEQGGLLPTAYFKDTVVTNGTLGGLSGVSASAASARLVFDGGYQRFTGFSTGAKNLAIVITNGADFAFADMGYLEYGVTTDVCTQRIDVVGGTFDYMSAGRTKWLGIGFNANHPNNHSVFHVGCDGLAKVDNFHVGYLGDGHLLVDGGRLETGALKVGTAATTCSVRGHSSIVVRGDSEIISGNTVEVGCKTGVGHDGKATLDGGVVEAYALTGKAAAGVNTAVLSADGGTLRPNNSGAVDIISGFSTAEVGPKGLTVDPNGKEKSKVTQAFVDKSGETGLFRVAGASGALTLSPASWAVSKTEVDGPVTLILNSALTTATALTVKNGGKLQLTGDAAVQVGSLAVDGGTLLFDAGQTLVVDGPATFRNLTFKCAVDPSGAALSDIIVVNGQLADADAKALARAVMDNACPEGLNGRLYAVYDEGTGKTTVKFAVEAKSDPLTDTTTWTGTTPDAWTDATGGWSDGVPTKDVKAVFAESATASKEVTVPADATVGAVGFTGDGYTLASGVLSVMTLPDAAQITAEAAVTNEIASDVFVANALGIDLVAGSKLTLSGALDASGYTKTGTGELVLAGENSIVGTATFAGGRTRVNSAVAFDAAKKAKTVLKSGTLTIDAGDGSETVIESPFQVAADNAREWTILDCRTPVTITDYQTPVQGGLIKRGPGKLTLKVKDGQDLAAVRARSANSYDANSVVNLAEDGSGPVATKADENYGYELTAFEGEVELVKADGETGVPKVKMSNGALGVNLRCGQGEGIPRLTLDGVDFDQTPGGDQFFLTVRKDSYSKQNDFVLLNGARLYAHQVNLGYNVWDSGYKVLVAMTNATLQGKSGFAFANANITPTAASKTAWTEIRAKDSSFLADNSVFTLDGGVKASFDNCVVSPTDQSKYAAFNIYRAGDGSGSWGEFALSSGSVFRVNSFDALTWQPSKDHQYFALAFDNATWDYGAGDFTLGTAWIAAGNVERFAIEMRGAGVRLAPAAGTTFTTEYPFTGAGGLIVDGPGTVKFAANTLKFTGAAWVRQGTLDAGGQKVAIRLEPGDAVPTLKDCDPTGRVLVDMGGAAYAKGDVLTVARLAGSTPMKFKAVNFADAELHGYFSVDGGEVKLTVGDKPGLMMLVR